MMYARHEYATTAQLRYLQQLGVPIPYGLSKQEATRLIAYNKHEGADPAPTEKQEKFLRWKGKWREGLTRAEASERIGRLKEGPRRPW